MKKFSVFMLVIGVLLVIAALVLPLVIMAQGGAATGIVGGAGLATWKLIFSQKTHWLAEIGIILALIGGILCRKSCKDHKRM